MTPRVEIFFDLSSPWTRIACHNFRQWAKGRNIDVVWRPFLVGGVFNAVNSSVYAGRQDRDNPKFRLSFVWLKEWAELAGVAMNFPSPHHPVKSVHAMRFCCTLEHDQGELLVFAEAVFEAYFAEQRNIDDPEVLIAIATSAGLDSKAMAEQANTDAVKQRLRDNTQEAIDRGVFGSPTFFVDRKYMYFGNDQLPLLQQRIEQCR